MRVKLVEDWSRAVAPTTCPSGEADSVPAAGAAAAAGGAMFAPPRFTEHAAADCEPAAPAATVPREVLIAGRRYALVPLPSPPPATSAASDPNAETMLTAREQQVVRLVADGLVNKQIANMLQISEWTVSTHLRRIFAKLGVDTRAAMVSRCIASLGVRWMDRA